MRTGKRRQSKNQATSKCKAVQNYINQEGFAGAIPSQSLINFLVLEGQAHIIQHFNAFCSCYMFFRVVHQRSAKHMKAESGVGWFTNIHISSEQNCNGNAASDCPAGSGSVGQKLDEISTSLPRTEAAQNPSLTITYLKSSQISSCTCMDGGIGHVRCQRALPCRLPGHAEPC